MWLVVAILLVVVFILYLLVRETLMGTRAFTRQTGTTPEVVPVNTAAPGAKKYRVWTNGTFNGVQGRYYMAAYGITQASANKIAAEAAATMEKPPTLQQVQIAAATMAIGTVAFYFRAQGDTAPFDGVKYLAPIGNFADVTSSDVFTLKDLPAETLVQVPAIDNAQVTACDRPDLCKSGTLGFGGIVTGSSLLFRPVAGGGFNITRQVGQGLESLQTGPFLCPFDAKGTSSTSQALIKACSTVGVGGPRIPVMSTGSGDVYYLEPVA